MSEAAVSRPGSESSGEERPVIVGVADGDPAVRQGVCALLRAAGFEARPFDALEALLAEEGDAPPDCAVVDLDLPGIPLAELLARLRRRRPGVVLIALATCTDAAGIVAATGAGAACVLEKPFPPQDLVERIGTLVGLVGADRSR